MKQEKNLSIELVKFLALLIILNGHSDKLYTSCSFLATGGAIGDALFFFCSGFTLFLGRMDRFDNWYKRRISRIYPSIFAWALISAVVLSKDNGILYTILHTGGWFVNCILIYYVVLYLVRWYFEDAQWIPWAITVGAIIVWYNFEDSSKPFMYGDTYFKWCHNFLFMLLGAYVGKGDIKISSNSKRNALLFVLNIVTFYGIIIITTKYPNLSKLQILSLTPLMGIVFYAYCICCSNLSKKLICSKFFWGGRLIASLCLETYIVQFAFLTPKLNNLFPLNLILIWAFILVVAYLTRCLGRIIKQIFEKENFRWGEVFSLIN